MKQKNIIINSLKESLLLVWKNKLFFLYLFMIEILFIAMFFYVSSIYIPRILENSKAMSDYMGQQKFDDITIASNILQQKNILGEDPLAISRNFNEIVRNFRIYFAYLFVLLVAFLSLSWSLTNRMMHKISFNQIKKVFFRIFAVLLSYLGLVFAFFFSLLNVSITEAAYDTSKIFAKYILFLIFAPILAYLMYVSLSLSLNTGLKDIVQRTFGIGIRKIHYILAVYFINLILFIVPIALLSFFINKEGYFLIVFISIILMIFSFVFGRILLINVINKLTAE